MVKVSVMVVVEVNARWLLLLTPDAPEVMPRPERLTTYFVPASSLET